MLGRGHRRKSVCLPRQLPPVESHTVRGLEIGGYAVTALLYESRKTRIYSAIKDGGKYVLKTVKADTPTPKDLASLRREYEVLKGLKVDGVVKAVELVTFGHGLALVLEDFKNGEILRQVIAHRRIRTDELLHIAIALTRILGELHKRGVVHKDVKPDNIQYDAESGRVQLIDFGISSTPSNISERRENKIEGTLAYMSPEQTGRMNRLVDHQTDFYSLGATLFELLTQQQPFHATEALGYIHCHMAKPPPDPCEVITSREGPDADLPPQGVCDVIAQLMAKTPEKRYHNADSLMMDLRFLQSRIALAQAGSKAAARELARFKAGKLDRHSRFVLSKKLYGRDKEVEAILEAFTRTSQNGSIEVAMVRGYSGIGKSSIVNQVQRAMFGRSDGASKRHYSRRKGHFITWKFDQLCKSTAGVTLAFGYLIEQILSEGTEAIREWADLILRAVGGNGQLLIDLLPELQVIIGIQPPIADLPPAEAQNRFNRTFQQFVRVFCSNDDDSRHDKINIGPLVMFVDDLQWADLASLKLLELIACDPELHHFMLIGAYRDNEVDATHPLRATLRELSNTNKVRLTDIEVKPLGHEHVLSLVMDTLRCDEARARGMADLLEEKTSGNPFFINQLLQSFFRDGLLRFSFYDLSMVPSDDEVGNESTNVSENEGDSVTYGRWEWKLKRLRHHAVTDNVVDLMVRQIQRLSLDTQKVLQTAAAIGDKFSLSTLGVVMELSSEEVELILLESLHAGLILPVTSRYNVFVTDSPLRTEDDYSEIVTSDRTYRFLHDRVQQAAYSLIPENERPAVHLKIGRRVLASMNGDMEKIEEAIFMIVDQIDMGIDIVLATPHSGHDRYAEEEKERLARLNFIAGKKARGAMAYLAAVRYLDLAIQLVESAGDAEQQPESDFLHRSTRRPSVCRENEKRDLTMDIFLEATIAHYLNTNFQRAEYLCKCMLEHARSAVEKVAVFEIQMQFHIQQHQMRPALEIGLAALEMLGVELVAERPALELSNEEYCEGLGDMKDEAMLAAMRILMNLCAPTYVLEPALNVRTAFTMVVLATKYGTSSLAAFGFGLYALTSFLFNLDEAYRAGSIGLRLMQKYHARELTAKLYGLFYAHVSIWRDPVRESLPHLERAIHVGLETGDLEWAGYDSFYYCDHLFFSGVSLEKVCENQHAYFQALVGRHQELQATYLNIWRRLVSRLALGKLEENYEFFGKIITDEEMLIHLKSINNKMFLFTFYLASGILAYYSRMYAKAIDHFQLAEENVMGVVGMMSNAQHKFYWSLALLAQAKLEPSGGVDKIALAQVTRNQELLEKWARHAPSNYQHKYQLVEALRATVTGEHWLAMDLYDAAIDGARSGDFIHEEALARRLASDFYLLRKRDRVANDYLLEAYYIYLRWGSVMMVQQLQECLPSRIETLASSARPQVRSLSVNGTNPSLSLSESSTDSPLANLSQSRITLSPTSSLSLSTSSPNSAYGKSRYWLVSIICSQMGIALQNARLFDQLSKRSAELQEINTKLEDELVVRRGIQEELEKAMELAKAAAVSKNQFLANMSHEIRTPLNAIIGMTGLLLDTQLTETQNEWLHLIEVSGNALLSLVNDILDLAKMESGKVSIVMEECSLVDSMREAMAMFVHASQTKEVKMHLHIDPVCPQHIKTDKIRLRQVLLNLLSNAMKFTPTGGTVTLSVTSRRVTVRESETIDPATTECIKTREIVDDPIDGDCDEVHVDVRDSGPGVGREMIDRLFQPFTQGDGSFSRKTGGTGLGLAISKQLVNLLGGRIWLDTSVTDGSSFHFTILCNRVKSSPPASPRNGIGLGLLSLRRPSLGLPLPPAALRASPPPTPPTSSRATTPATSRELEALHEVSPRSISHTSDSPQAPSGAQPAHCKEETKKREAADLSLLVVEDNKTNQKLLLQLLKRLMYEADVANDGVEAVAAWHTKPYDVILMDLQMPNMDGLTAAQVIMAECPTGQAPQIIAVSANVYESDKASCSAAGMVDFIEKPIRMPILRTSLERCIQRINGETPASPPA